MMNIVELGQQTVKFLVYSPVLKLPPQFGGDYQRIGFVYSLMNLLTLTDDLPGLMADLYEEWGVEQARVLRLDADWRAQWKEWEREEGDPAALTEWQQLDAEWRTFKDAWQHRFNKRLAGHLLVSVQAAEAGKPWPLDVPQPNPANPETLLVLEPSVLREQGVFLVLDYLVSNEWLQEVGKRSTGFRRR